MILIGWAHLLAAVAWIGGMLFLSLVLAPVFKREGLGDNLRPLFRAVAKRFRVVVWASIIVLLVTGPILVTAKTELSARDQGWGRAFTAKMSLVLILLGLTALHDFWLGPRAMRTRNSSPQNGETRIDPVARFTPWIARIALLVGLAILCLGIMVAKS